MDALRLTEAVIIFLGIWINILFAFTLYMRPLNSVTTTILLRNQSLYDLFVCLCTFLSLILPRFVKSTENVAVDIIYCNLWTSQYIQYLFLMASTQNVVCTTADRYLAVLRPFIYRINRQKYITGMYIYILLASIIVPIPKWFDVKMFNGSCIFEKSIEKSPLNIFQNCYSIFWAIMIYFFPSIYFSIVYWKVIVKLRCLIKPAKKKSAVNARISTARNVTIAIFFVTAVYVAAYTLDTTVFLLDQWRIIPPVTGTTLDDIRTFILTMNSMINPEMYFCLMRQIRYRIFSLCLPQYKNKYF